jgi:hypothetical protein
MMKTKDLKINKFRTITLLSFAVVGLFYQNCAPQHAFYQEEQTVQSSMDDVGKTLKACQFVGRQALSSILSSQLGLARGDVAMANEQGNPLRSNACKTYSVTGGNAARDCFYLAEFRSELETSECNESTFKLVSKIMINGCVQGLQARDVASRLFPQGSGDPSQIYRAFTGQVIPDNERQILVELAQQMASEELKQVAICSAVGASLASISVN